MKQYVPNHPKFDTTKTFKNFHFIKICLFWLIKELIKTASNEPSFFSSKRLERMILFLNACIGLDLIVYHLVKENKLEVTGALGIYGAQMVYAGFTTKQMFTEKKHEHEIITNTEEQK